MFDPSVFTTLAFVTLDEQGDRDFSFARKPGADVSLRPQELKLDLIREAKVFHFGTLSMTDEPARTATIRGVEYARTHGQMVTCDPNLRLSLWDSEREAWQWMQWAVAQADVVKLSREELKFLWDCTPAVGADRLLDQGAHLVVITQGADGCLIQNRKASVKLGAPEVEAVDTTGAGDIFGGAMVSRLLELDQPLDQLNGKQLRQIARFATAAAALSTTKSGGIPSVPALDEVETLAADTSW